MQKSSKLLKKCIANRLAISGILRAFGKDWVICQDNKYGLI